MTCKFCAVVVAGVLLAVPLAAQYGRPIEASVENGRYRHAGLALEVPETWKYEGTWTGEGVADETAHWTDAQSGISLFVYRNHQQSAPLPRLASDVITQKTGQRERQGYLHWRVRADSVEQRSIGGHQALFAMADFQTRTNKPRLECLTWIFSPESTVLFFASLGPDQLGQFRPVFDTIVQSASLQ